MKLDACLSHAEWWHLYAQYAHNWSNSFTDTRITVCSFYSVKPRFWHLHWDCPNSETKPEEIFHSHSILKLICCEVYPLLGFLGKIYGFNFYNILIKMAYGIFQVRNFTCNLLWYGWWCASIPTFRIASRILVLIQEKCGNEICKMYIFLRLLREDLIVIMLYTVTYLK